MAKTKTTAIRRVLIANRGEIACRVIKTCRRLGIETVAVYSDPDRLALHVQSADKAYALGGSEARESYLDIDKIIRVAKRAKVDAVHPGYGFLSENPAFAQRLKAEGILFIGPSAGVMRALGDKISAKKLAHKVKVPLVPGHLCESKKQADLINEITAFTKKAGFPILLKASAGGGGRGMRRVNKSTEIAEAVASAQREAEAAFGDGRIFVERLVSEARHIEVQIIADNHGNVFSLFDRDCSMQRNHQKVIEEAPAPNISDVTRNKIHAAARKLCEAADYRNAGTVEFLLDRDENFYFLEVNSRLQVEHPVTEAILKLDLVELQLQVAMGRNLKETLRQENIKPSGSAIELRVCAEIPEQNFIASTGVLESLNIAQPADGAGLRLDSGFNCGDAVSHYYDSLLAKVIVHRDTRPQAIAAAKDVAARSLIAGVKTNLGFLGALLRSAEFSSVTHSTRFAHSLLPETKELQRQAETCAALYLAFQLALGNTNGKDPWQSSSAWRLTGSPVQRGQFVVSGQPCSVAVSPLDKNRYALQGDNIEAETITVEHVNLERMRYRSLNAGNELQVFCAAQGVWLQDGRGVWELKPAKPQSRSAKRDSELGESEILAPLPGKIISVKAVIGDKLKIGDPIIVLESMKMEHIVRAPRAAEVKEVLVKCGDVVEAQAKLAAINN